MNFSKLAMTIIIAISCLSACDNPQTISPKSHILIPEYENRLNIYKEITLEVDLAHLSKNQKQMITLLIEASDIVDELFWQQAFGQDKELFLANITDEKTRKFAEINYGPWDRLNNDTVFLTNFKDKNLGAQFYPSDMSKNEFEQVTISHKKDLYTLIYRDDNNELTTIAYSEYYAEEINRVAAILDKASKFADDKEFSNYLRMRAQALRTDQYQASDLAWMDMKNNPIDVVIGPIETYEDQLYGYRAAFESYVLLKDNSWSKKLSKYIQYLPALQKGLPVNKKYKKEKPGSDADLNVYNVLYYSGHANAGSKTIAINLPNDEQVQLEKGTRRLQLKNAMRAKFDNILLPIANELIVPEQRKHITFNAFFSNTMFHEIAHGLGIKNTINKKGTVREALKEHASALEEGKADVLGLYMIKQLLNKGAIQEGTLKDYYTTFLAGIFRSVRFGASSAHGKANMIRFNYFENQQAFTRNEQGLYQVNMEKMSAAIDSLSELILTLQGDGDYDAVELLVDKNSHISPSLAKDLAKLSSENIPVDITFKQGKKILGL